MNDLITLGALPISVAMHAAVGDSAWFSQEHVVAADLADGFAEGCRQAGAVWGGGETPTLQGIVNPETIALAGSALGRIVPKSNRITGDVKQGDAIVPARQRRCANQWIVVVPKDRRSVYRWGTSPRSGRVGPMEKPLLDPSVIYVDFVAACQKAHLALHYTAHITGHGWRKLMRLEEPLVYQITEIRKPTPLFEFIMSGRSGRCEGSLRDVQHGSGFCRLRQRQRCESNDRACQQCRL